MESAEQHPPVVGLRPLPEVERIRSVYAARRPGDLYSPLRADQIAIWASRARVWGAMLAHDERELGVVLEVGCGTGAALRWANDVGASQVIGIDVILSRLEGARALNPSLNLVAGSGTMLPIASRTVDTVICSTLFSSILSDGVAQAVADEIKRVLRPGGCVLWFDFRRENPRNTHVRAIGAHRLQRTFSGWDIRVEPVVLLPPIARRLLRVPRIAAMLEVLPLLRSHLAGVLIPPPIAAPTGGSRSSNTAD